MLPSWWHCGGHVACAQPGELHVRRCHPGARTVPTLPPAAGACPPCRATIRPAPCIPPFSLLHPLRSRAVGGILERPRATGHRANRNGHHGAAGAAAHLAPPTSLGPLQGRWTFNSVSWYCHCCPEAGGRRVQGPGPPCISGAGISRNAATQVHVALPLCPCLPAAPVGSLSAPTPLPARPSPSMLQQAARRAVAALIGRSAALEAAVPAAARSLATAPPQRPSEEDDDAFELLPPGCSLKVGCRVVAGDAARC